MTRKFGTLLGTSIAVLTIAAVFTSLPALAAGDVPKVPTRNKPAAVPVRPATPGEQQTNSGVQQNTRPGARMIIPSSLGVDSAFQLDGATICFDYKVDLELPLSEFFQANGMTYEPVAWDGPGESWASFLRGECDVLVVNALDAANAEIELSLLDGSQKFIVLPETAD